MVVLAAVGLAAIAVAAVVDRIAATVNDVAIPESEVRKAMIVAGLPRETGESDGAYRGRVLETVIVPIPDGQAEPVPGGAAAEMREIFYQLDQVLAAAGADRAAVVSVRLFLQHVNRDIAAVNEVYKAYFNGHSPMRIAPSSIHIGARHPL